MQQQSLNERLSRITTLWSLVYRAHGGMADDVTSAQKVLMERYGGAIHRYLLGALRDPHAADDLFQEFSLRFLRGDFKNANPQRGRFRDFVKTSVFHLIVDHQKRKQKQAAPLPSEVGDRAASPAGTVSEEEFLASWREELLDRTWLALQAFEQETAQPYYTVLRFRTDQPMLSSEAMAEQIGTRLGKTYKVDAFRQTLHRAREKFADLLLEEVEQSLEHVGRERLDEELADLGLLTYCRGALERRDRK
jgi:RNA polymerase sigma-70 factor (ECF subfamily)